MDKLSLREAVKHFDVSRPTLQKALKSGRLTGVQDGNGHWTIDPSELARVYNPRRSKVEEVDQTRPANFTALNTVPAEEISNLRAQLAEAEKRAAVAQALADERGQHLDDLRRLLPSPKTVRPKRWWFWK